MLFCVDYSKEKCEFVENCFYNRLYGIYDGICEDNFWPDNSKIYCPLTKGTARVSNITKLEYYMRRAINEQDSKD